VAVLESLLINLGFVVETKEINNFSNHLSKMSKHMLEVGAAASAMGFLIYESAKKFGESSEELAISSERAGLATREFQELSGAASLAGISAESFTGSLQTFNNNIGQASLGMGSAIRVFAIMGINLQDTNLKMRSTSDLLSEVSDKLRTYSKPRQIAFAQQLGFSGESLRLLLLGSKRIKELRKQVEETGAVRSNLSIENGEKFIEQLKIIKLRVKGVKDSIQESLLPTVLKLSKSFEKWFEANKKVIEKDISLVLNGTSKSLGILFYWIGKVTTALEYLAKPLGGLPNLIAAVIGAFAIKKLSNISLALLGIAKHMFLVGKSILAFDFVAAFGKILASIKATTIAFLTLDLAAIPIEAIIGLVLALGAALIFVLGKGSFSKGLIVAFDLIKKSVNGVVSVVHGLISDLKTLKDLFTYTTNTIGVVTGIEKETKEEKIKRLASGANLASRVSDFNKGSENIIFSRRPFKLSTSFDDVGSMSNKNNISTNNISNKSSSADNKTIVNATINVSGAQNPQALAKTITDHINNMARQAERNIKNPVVA